MKETVPLCYMRVWCRDRHAWLSFKTKAQDRYLISPEGYFVELPDGSITRISPRICFPVVDNLPSVRVADLMVRTQIGAEAVFASVPLRTSERQQPKEVSIDAISKDPLEGIKATPPLTAVERVVLLRMLGNGIMTRDSIKAIAERRGPTGKSAGELIVESNICHWESMLGHCLDIRPPSRLDPANPKSIVDRREWELTGEILYALGKINRTELEHALKLKRDAGQALGQILTAMGACQSEHVQRCLAIQHHVKEAGGYDNVALIGKLLVAQQIISENDLEEALWKQKVSRQPLSGILLQMGVCEQQDIDGYQARLAPEFQQAIDEQAMGSHLVKTAVLTRAQLEEALRIQMRGRQVLGELLVSYGLCKSEDIEAVMALQYDVREAYRSGVERLGALLIARGSVPAHVVEEALSAQAIGRQPFGAILVAIGASTTGDVRHALDVQKLWRLRPSQHGDRLGEVLVKHGALLPEQLQAPLLEHMREEKPLGRILLERGICKPEAIVQALLQRDVGRQEDFHQFIEEHRRPEQPVDHQVYPKHAEVDGGKMVDKISALARVRREKDKN